MSVSLAAAEHPPASGSSSLASPGRFSPTEPCLLFCFLFLPPLAGIALTALSIVWHRHKVRADRAIAWFTGRVWLEVKLLLLVPFLWACALAGMCCLAALMGRCSPTALCATSPSPGPVVGLPLYQRPAVQFRTPQGAEPVRRLCAPAPAADPAPPRRPAGRPTDDLAVCRLPPLFPVLRPVRAGLSGVPSAPSAAAPALYGRDRADRSPGVAGQGKAAALPLSWTPCWPALRPPGREGWREPLPAAGLRFPRCSGAALPHGGRVCVPHWPNR